MSDTYLDLIKSRKSIRTYEDRPLDPEILDKLRGFMSSVKEPYGIPSEFRLLETKKHGLKSPVVSGARHYIAGKLPKEPHCEEAFGFALESVVLYAWSLGVGTVWLGGTFDRADFEQAMELMESELMPCVTPIGYPASKMSIRENLMRKGVRADSRMESGEILLNPDLSSCSPAPDDAVSRMIEAVRWAPSAVNKQPWRIIKSGPAFHFYRKKNKGFLSDAAGDLQKIDLGIALCHFDFAARREGLEPAFSLSDPGITVPEDMLYIATYTIK